MRDDFCIVDESVEIEAFRARNLWIGVLHQLLLDAFKRPVSDRFKEEERVYNRDNAQRYLSTPSRDLSIMCDFTDCNMATINRCARYYTSQHGVDWYHATDFLKAKGKYRVFGIQNAFFERGRKA